MSGLSKNKKSILFTADALFAALIIVGAIVVFSQNYITEDKAMDLSYVSYDLIRSFSSIKTSELNNSYLKELIANGTVNNTNNTLFETIGELYVLNKTAEARELAENISYQLIPEKYGFAIFINDEEIYSNGMPVTKSLLTTKRLISGIEKFKPIRGSSSKVYLQGLEEKKDSAYIFFGGFIGQGNISKFTEEIPADANLTGIYMEMEIGDQAGDQFNVYFNGAKCNGDFNRTSSSMRADSYGLSSCVQNLTPGAKNNVSIVFIPSTNFDIAYISGGFIRFDYTTKEMYKAAPEGYKKYYFPSIDGLINIYSSIYIPGDISNITIQLKYLVNHTNGSNSTFYMKMGNTTVLSDTNSTTIQTVQLDGSVLISLGLNYTFLSGKNIPIRVGAENVSYFSEYLGKADSVLITDVSGSMAWEMDSSSTGTNRACDDSNLGDSDTRRISVAECLDKNFTSDMLNISGNLVGLVSYESNTQETESLTDNVTFLTNEINQYSSETGGGTCICCGINSGRDLLIVGLGTTTLIGSGQTWLYNNFSLEGNPVQDASNNSWYDLVYDNESQWFSGSAILGATNSYVYTPTVTTEMGSSFSDITGNVLYADLWEHFNDNPGAPNDFSSSTLNQTANTWGMGAGDDGWDTASGVFEYNAGVEEFNFYNNRLRFDTTENNGNDASGAYGIEVNITQEMFDALNSSDGSATLSFDWWKDERSSFELDDGVWIKAYWNSSSSGIHYLGGNYDSGHNPSDAYNEIYADDDPDGDASGSFSQSIKTWIEAPGMYYFALGGKLKRNSAWEDVWFMFDNIEIKITGSPSNVSGMIYADLWEHFNDNPGAPNDFSSGTLNSTAVTYGVGGADDGWDYDSPEDGSGPFGYDDDIDYNLIQSGVIELDNNDGGSGNVCSGRDCSGAYGILINITQDMYNLLQSNGEAKISFWYEWDDRSNNVFETSDQVWVKARWTHPNGDSTYLGSSLDSGDNGEDSDNEVATTDNPDNDFSGTFYKDVSSLINQSGMYYLEIGGKLLGTENQEYGWWRFDDVELLITNITDHYYLRKNFTITDITQVKKGFLNILSDDMVNVYLNGNPIYSDTSDNIAQFWNKRGVKVDGTYFRTGINVVAVELQNSLQAAKFDLELIGLNVSRNKAMIVMTDGEANVECGEQGTTGDLDNDGSSDTASDDAIQAACDAREDYGISVYAVGISDDPDIDTLSGIAECGGGRYTKSDNITALQEFYKDVAAEIMDVARVEQKIVVIGSPTLSKLYGDESWVEINFTPPVLPPQFGEIAVNFEDSLTQNCSFLVNVSPKLRLIESKVSTYSSSKWYDYLFVNGNATYNLSMFNPEYEFLGDPFIASFNPSRMTPGTVDNITIRTGIEPVNSTGCSENSTFFYTGLMKASVSYSDVLEFANGCIWTVEFEGGGYTTLNVPLDYDGTSNCTYTNGDISYNSDDAYDDAMYKLMRNLDLDEDGRIDIDLVENNLIVDAISVHKVPYPWGPAIAEVRVWQ